MHVLSLTNCLESDQEVVKCRRRSEVNGVVRVVVGVGHFFL